MSPFTTTEADFGDWAPARQLTLEQARKRSRFIRLWRWICIGVAGGAGALVAVFAAVNSLGGDLGFDDQLSARDALKMINPRFTGRSADGFAYVLNATTAVRRSRVSDIVDLERPNFAGAGGQVMTAPKGVFLEGRQVLDLMGGVVLTDPTGNRFDTASAHVDSDADRVVGSGAIKGSGPLGSIRGDAYEIKTNTGTLYIRGNVRGMIKDSGP